MQRLAAQRPHRALGACSQSSQPTMDRVWTDGGEAQREIP
jgi:hypothetical protein